MDKHYKGHGYFQKQPRVWASKLPKKGTKQE